MLLRLNVHADGDTDERPELDAQRSADWTTDDDADERPDWPAEHCTDWPTYERSYRTAKRGTDRTAKRGTDGAAKRGTDGAAHQRAHRVAHGRTDSDADQRSHSHPDAGPDGLFRRRDRRNVRYSIDEPGELHIHRAGGGRTERHCPDAGWRIPVRVQLRREFGDLRVLVYGNRFVQLVGEVLLRPHRSTDDVPDQGTH